MLNLFRILGFTACAGRQMALTALLGAGLLLPGCGQKGPLFLPAPPSASIAQPAAVEAGTTAKATASNEQRGR